MAEDFFFLGEDVDDFLLFGGDFRKVGFVDADHDGHYMLQEILLNSKVESLADGAAHQAAHDVALLFVAGHDTVDRQECGGAQVIGNHAHGCSGRIILFAAQALQLLNNRPDNTNLKHVRVVECRCRDAFQPAAKVDILLGQFFETIFGAHIFHKHTVGDFDEAAAVAVGVAVGAVLRVVRNEVELVEDFAIAAARLANRHFTGNAGAAPPVFLGVVEEDALTRLNTALVTGSFAANIGGSGFHALAFKNFAHNLGTFFVLWQTVGLIADKTGGVEFAWV